MAHEIDTTLQRLASSFKRFWPDVAADLTRLPEARDLTLRDLAVLMLHGAGDRVSRTAVEAIVGAADADAVIGTLAGRGWIADETNDVILTARGRELLDRLVATRLATATRLLGELPEDVRALQLKAWEALAQALEREEALVEA